MNVSRFIGNPLEKQIEEKKERGEKVSAPKLDGLENFVEGCGKSTFRCPACAEDGKDEKGEHGFVYESGAFGCVVNPGDEGKEHRRRMLELAPQLGGGKVRKVRRRDTTAEKKARDAKAAALWEAIKAELARQPSEIPGGATLIPRSNHAFFAFCRCFSPGDVVWVGGRYDSNAAFARHLFFADPAADPSAVWEMIEREGLDHASGLLWKAEATSRKAENVAGRRLLVVEHDKATIEETVALIRYAKERLGWKLKMVISTGGKGIHGLFDAAGIEPMKLAADAKLLASLGADPAALNRSATRIPGAIRQPQDGKPGGKRQEILWLNPQLS